MLILILGLFVFLLDRWSKILVVRNLVPGESIPLWPGIFHLTYVRNTGAAFSLLANQRGVLLFTSLVVIVIILFFLRSLDRLGWLHRLSFGLILGGAAGNLYDRILSGQVVDFLDFRVWPVFNLADAAIVVGVLLLAYLYTFGEEKKKGEKGLF